LALAGGGRKHQILNCVSYKETSARFISTRLSFLAAIAIIVAAVQDRRAAITPAAAIIIVATAV
jgi:hypothetical protein